MISLKISISVHPMAELKTKIKLESDSPEKGLPFENLVVEALPTTMDSTDLRLQFINAHMHDFSYDQNKPIEPLASPKKSWWKRFLAYYFPTNSVQKEII